MQNTKLVIGIMSGTSMDGIDVVLCRILPHATKRDEVQFIDFLMKPYPPQVRERLLLLAEGQYGGTREIALMHALLGELYADTVEALLTQAGYSASDIDLIASHGQTLYHSLEKEHYLGYPIQSSLQLGEASFLASRFQCLVVSDFRVRDIAEGGLGAPLVPFVDYALYGSDSENLVYLNIGGISNITYIPRDGKNIIGFDTGPGNMLIDQAVVRYSKGEAEYDHDGLLASQGKVCSELLEKWLAEDYYQQAPPKNSGRENFGHLKLLAYEEDREQLGISYLDFIASLTALTAHCNTRAIKQFCPETPQRIIVSGGGSRNKTLMGALATLNPESVVESGDVLGYPNDAKEALAFAYLGYRTSINKHNNIPQATGARKEVIMGKISQ